MTKTAWIFHILGCRAWEGATLIDYQNAPLSRGSSGSKDCTARFTPFEYSKSSLKKKSQKWRNIHDPIVIWKCLHCGFVWGHFVTHNAVRCSVLQCVTVWGHFVTHCNTLQRTATYCNTQHATAAHCSTLQHTARHCNTLQHTEAHRSRGFRVCVRVWLIHNSVQIRTNGVLLNKAAKWRALSVFCKQNPAEIQHPMGLHKRQHTATQCNVLQRTATYCNALQRTATHCNTL